MAGAVLVGNVALMADTASPPRPHMSERPKIWPLDPLPLPRVKRDPPPLPFVLSVVATSDSPAAPSRTHRNPLFGTKSWWKRRGEVRDGVAASSEESSEWGGVDENGDEDGAAWEEWQEELKNLVKEMEEMEELEKAAEDLQTQADLESANSEETEEQKRERVRKELEKVFVN